MTALFLLFALVANAAEVRTWTSASGNHETEAEFVKISDDGKTITLRKTDGKKTDVPLVRLSGADREYVAKQKKTSPATTTSKTGPPKPTMPRNIVTEQECINAVLSMIDDAADREVVLKWLNVCDALEYDKKGKVIYCKKKIPPEFVGGRISLIRPSIMVFPFTRETWGGFSIDTADSKPLFSDEIIITDKDGGVWKGAPREWKDVVESIDKKVWVLEYASFGFPNNFTEDEVDAVMEALTKNDRCNIRISGSKGYRDIAITPDKARELRLFYDAYNSIKKYCKERR